MITRKLSNIIKGKFLKGKAIVLLFLCFQAVSCSHEIKDGITEKNYLKVDQEIWDAYERDSEKVWELKSTHPEKSDSLNLILKQIEDIASQKNRAAALKYASVPSGLQRLFMVRLDIPKDTLMKAFNELPKKMQESDYGKSLLLHIQSEQIEEGDSYYDFEAVDSKGEEFRLSALDNKNILLIYDGLACMGESGRTFLKNLYQSSNRDDFQIVVYGKCSNIKQLKNLKSQYDVDYILVSDFLNDHSPVKIMYGAQVVPTCFLINQDRKVIIKSIGLPEERLLQMKQEDWRH